MILRPIRWALSAFTTLIALYVFFFVPIGRRTLYEYARRIAGTNEAQEFGHDMGTAGEQVLEKAQHEMRHSFPLPSTTGDAGASAPSFLDPPVVPPRDAPQPPPVPSPAAPASPLRHHRHAH